MSSTTFVELARSRGVARIEIPITQRDYAQGRLDVISIREAFLDVLHAAATGGSRVHLDFVYGEIVVDKLIPLDGQQRLTALFLLHWYLAARTNAATDQPGTQLPALTYETRHSSRVFCEKLVQQRPSFPLAPSAKMSAWLRNRSWFVRAWQRDPTIESMLVVLDAIHVRFESADCEAAWKRLVDSEYPAITFDFLPIENLGRPDELYIKMNSRGKPLTQFENFKAGFEELVRRVASELHRDVCRKIDNDWSDVFWRLRNKENAIDERLLNYFAFVTETLGHLHGLAIAREATPLDRAKAVFGDPNGPGPTIASLVSAFDVWVGHDIADVFRGIFTSGAYEEGKVALFDGVQLFDSCCRDYGRGFSLAKQVILFAVIQHLESSSEQFPSRIRTVRNLVLNSLSEVRQDLLPTILASVHRFVIDGNVADIRGFNRRQVREEAAKLAFISEQIELGGILRRLEDHPLLRGCLAVFELDATHFERRAEAFLELFNGPGGLPHPGIAAALLACGDYSRRTKQGRFQFAIASRDLWRDLFTAPGTSGFKAILQLLLDAVAMPDGASISERVTRIVEAYLVQQEGQGEFDWRYYFVKYDEMRSSPSGIYASASGEMGFNVCMLERTQMNGYYRDPFLTAIYEKIGRPKDVTAPWFINNYPHHPRWLKVDRGGTCVRCTEAGFILQAPTDDAFRSAFDVVAKRHSIDDSGLVRVSQGERDGEAFDKSDRVLIGVGLLRDLLAMQPTP